jgi:hypothetical protein
MLLAVVNLLQKKVLSFYHESVHWMQLHVLDLYYNYPWVMPMYYRIFPPPKSTWCALMEYKGVKMPSQNIWKETLIDLDSFCARPDDVFLVTYPKSGTHMLAPILMDLLWRSAPDFEARKQYANSNAPGHYPLFLEFGHPHYKSQDQALQWSPRIFQTHLPLSLFPSSVLKQGCRIVYLARDPRACTLSALHFCRSKKRKLFDPSIEYLVRSHWDQDVELYSGWHAHLADWARYSHHALNVHLVCFEDLVAAPLKAIADLAAFLAVDLPAGAAARIAADNSLDAARAAAAPGNRKYFRRGAAAPDEEWARLVPAPARAAAEALIAARWAAAGMHALLRRNPCLRRYAPPGPPPGPAPRAGAAPAPIRRVGVVGLGAHNRRVYFPYLERAGLELALVIDLESQVTYFI